ncbi:MAG: hypothetical protein KJP16_11995 [Gammaproteobacteria bacterium]|nr:hypothetical protein [Gammaproteobacteria bacterium]NNC57234.1 hypothetical protein [Woeseiaceae bacterium]NNL51528.1 hypothetical protein [Woeseiaceae bacterium]
MRNALLALIAGSLLCGCLSSEEPAVTREKAAAYNPSGNSSPTISGNPPSAILFGELYEFKPNAADPDGDELTFQITNRPTWASFNASTGRLSGQPTLGNIGTFADIVITVSDGEASRSLAAFSITVRQAAADSSGNSSPTISGNPPPAIMFGESYEFKPNAADPDGDALSFQVTNKPNWASFEPATGRLSGQPTFGNIGAYSGIVITVSDGEATRSLPAFSITVSQTALGNVTLNWTAPLQNTDGTALLDLAGYTIYYGNDSRSYDHEIRIDNPGMTTYVVDFLVPDTYYFAATAFNSQGVESEWSGEAIRTVK